MADEKFVDVVCTNSSGNVVTVRLPEGHDMVAHLQKMARRDDLVKAEVKPVKPAKAEGK